MSRKLALMTTLIIVFVGMFMLAFTIQSARASGTIYIRSDGSIEPSGVPVSTHDNITYMLTDNIINTSIVVERSNITIDGMEYTVDGCGSFANGFTLSGVNNVTIKNISIKGFYNSIYLNSTSRILIFRNNIANSTDSGVKLYLSHNNTIYENNFSNNFYALSFRLSSYNTVLANKIMNNKDGVFLDASSENIISGNNVTHNGRRGVVLLASWGNTVSGNRIIDNTNYGVRLYQASNNTVSRNSITHNIYGAWLFLSSNNEFYQNNFIDNSQHVDIESVAFANFWDNGFEGNYWSNCTGVDVDYDGIGDAAHDIYVNNTDNYPLMGMFYSFNTSLGCYVDVISNSTIESFEYFESNNTIKLCVSYFSNMTTQSYGFCRVCIPIDLISPPYHIIIDKGQTPVLNNRTVAENQTHKWIYFAYQHSIHEIIIVPDFPSFLITSLFMIATLLAVTVYRIKHSL